jgi:hypothetical protein
VAPRPGDDFVAPGKKLLKIVKISSNISQTFVQIVLLTSGRGPVKNKKNQKKIGGS